MSSTDRHRPRTVLEAQSHLHRWNMQLVREREARFREAREAGVTPDQIALITGAPVEDVLDILGERATDATPAMSGWVFM
jgi:hypothetical protein